MYRVAKVDYKKLAKSNSRLAYWINILKSKMTGETKKLVMNTLGQSYKLNYLYYIKFFKSHKLLAENILGRKFSKEHNTLFYSEEIENDLIVQYIPALHHEMNKNKVSPSLVEDCVAALLLGLRESVWKYQRADIKFSTYAINGLRNNIIFFKKRYNKNKKENMPREYFIEEFFMHGQENSHDRLDILADSSADFQDKVNIFDFIKSIQMDADISPAQIKSVFSQLQGKPYDSKTFKKAKLKLSAFITENREKLPDMEQII